MTVHKSLKEANKHVEELEKRVHQLADEKYTEVFNKQQLQEQLHVLSTKLATAIDTYEKLAFASVNRTKEFDELRAEYNAMMLLRNSWNERCTNETKAHNETKEKLNKLISERDTKILALQTRIDVLSADNERLDNEALTRELQYNKINRKNIAFEHILNAIANLGETAAHV